MGSETEWRGWRGLWLQIGDDAVCNVRMCVLSCGIPTLMMRTKVLMVRKGESDSVDVLMSIVASVNAAG